MAAAVRIAIGDACLTQALVFGEEFRGRADPMPHIVFDVVEHDERCFARDQAESLAEAANFGAIQIVVAL